MPRLIQDVTPGKPLTNLDRERMFVVPLSQNDFGLLMIALRYNASIGDNELILKMEKAWKACEKQPESRLGATARNNTARHPQPGETVTPSDDGQPQTDAVESPST